MLQQNPSARKPRLVIPQKNLRMETPTTTLTELQERDVRTLLGNANHDQVAKTSLWDAHQDVTESRVYLHAMQNRISVEPGKIFLAWTVRDRAEKEVIGTITLTQLSELCAQVGFVFHYDHWRRRLPIEALHKILDWSFANFANFERIQARCFPRNVTSTALLERAGLAFEGVNRAMAKVHGEPADLSCYAITRQSWQLLSKGGWPTGENGDEGHI